MKRLFANRISLLYYLSTTSLPVPSNSFSPLTTTILTTTGNCFSTRMLSSSTTDDNNNIGLSEIGKQQTENKSTPMSSSTATSSSSSWRERIEISIAKSRKIRGGNYVQIATVDPKTLEPRCRTVVFRGFLKPNPNEKVLVNDDKIMNPSSLPCIMKMITDKRSSKFEEVTKSDLDNSLSMGNNSVEMVWWFSKSSEQYRIRGQLKFVGEDESDEYLLQSRKEQWGNLSDPAREQFYWEDPGLHFVNAESKVPTGGRDDSGKVLPPPSNFLLMLLYPTRCDYLRLGDNFRQIDNLADDGTWNFDRVTP